MTDINKCLICGRLGRDAEVRYTQAGAAVATLSVATSEKWTGKDGADKDKAEWHRVTAWGKLADACKVSGTKGARVWVEGRLQTREWTNREGAKVKSTEINAESVIFVGAEGARESGPGRAADGERAEPQGRPEAPANGQRDLSVDRNGPEGPKPLLPAEADAGDGVPF